MPQSDRPATLRDIAKALGIGHATVSRALSGHPRVKPETREKVEAMAKKMGYTPDPMLKSLIRRRWPEGSTNHQIKIALVHYKKQFTRQGKVEPKPNRNQSLFAPLYDRLAQKAKSHGVQFDTCRIEDFANPASMAKAMYHQGVDGLILNTVGPAEPIGFDLSPYTAVCLGEEDGNVRQHSITVDWFDVINLSVDKARAAGKQRIGFLSISREKPVVDRRIEAALTYQRQQLEQAHGEQPPLFNYLPEDEEKIYYKKAIKRFEKWYKQYQPDCLIDLNIVSYWWLKDLGIQTPEDCSLIQVMRSDHPLYEHITSVNHRTDIQASWAIELMIQQVTTGQKGIPEEPIRLTVPPGWNAGKTLR